MGHPVLGISPFGVLTAVNLSVALAELAGYALHRLMHSERFPLLSRSHMIHHLQLYGPDQAMRAPEYKRATRDCASLGNMGMEWVLPSAAILPACWLLMWSIGVGWRYQLLATIALLAWPIFMFSYLHDRMHVQDFWKERAPLLSIWFKKARRLHDVHHRSLNDEGRMNRNFGIGFFFFDRLFDTLSKKHCPLNKHGYRAAMRRYRLQTPAEEELTDFPSGYRV